MILVSFNEVVTRFTRVEFFDYDEVVTKVSNSSRNPKKLKYCLSGNQSFYECIIQY